MKINEIISEAARTPLGKSAREALPNLTAYDTLDNNNHPYLAYRFGLALAPSPSRDINREGPLGSDFVMIDYSDADAEIRKGAEQTMGITPTRQTGRGSYETPDTNKSSPVAKPKKNKYGV